MSYVVLVVMEIYPLMKFNKWMIGTLMFMFVEYNNSNLINETIRSIFSTYKR